MAVSVSEDILLPVRILESLVTLLGKRKRALDRIIFIKQFPDISSSRFAYKHEGVEIYTNQERTYVGLENQGVFRRLVSQDSLIYEVKWYVRAIPQNIPPQLGSKALVEYVRSIIR